MAKKEHPRDEDARFRCTAKEKAEMAKAADRGGETFSNWARRILLEAARNQLRKK
jgi:hypothetical protein